MADRGSSPWSICEAVHNYRHADIDDENTHRSRSSRTNGVLSGNSRAGATGRLLPLRVADTLKTLGATGRLAARVRCVEIPDGDDPYQTRVRRAGLKLALRSARLNGSGATGQLAGACRVRRGP